LNRKKLEEAVRKAIKKVANEGKYQKHVRKTYRNMFAKIAQGKRKNTPPFTEDPHMGKSAPPGQGDQ
jgi:hypothetical protein|tara:strand:- start:80 stop:280 length:201 start_codon:yes stop_codon:yes gene_type:complete